MKVSSLKPTFRRNPVSGAAGYIIQVVRDSGFASLVVNAAISTATASYTPITKLLTHITLY